MNQNFLNRKKSWFWSVFKDYGPLGYMLNLSPYPNSKHIAMTDKW